MIIRPEAVFNLVETTNFFQGVDGMRISAQCQDLLANEGIIDVVDLVNFSDEMLDKVDRNLKKPIGTMANPNAGQPDEPAVIPIPPVAMSAFSLEYAKKSANALRYYGIVGRVVTPQNMNSEVIYFLNDAIDALNDRSKEAKGEPPIYDPKTIDILRHQELVLQHFDMVIGSRGIPLSACLRRHWDPVVPAPPLLPNRPYSLALGSVRAELVDRATLNHPNYDDDNGRIFEALEKMYAATNIAATLKAFKQKKDGRNAWLAVKSQYMGTEKWRSALKKQEEIVTKRVWKGNSNYTLEDHISVHRTANAMFDNADLGEVEGYQPPEMRRRVERLLDSILCTHPMLLAAIANVRKDEDNGDESMMYNFEKAAAYLIPNCPVASKIRQKPNPYKAHISASTGGKQPFARSKGKTGVEFRFYRKDEYNKLTEDQKRELKEFRAARRATVKAPARKVHQFGKRRKFQGREVGIRGKKYKSNHDTKNVRNITRNVKAMAAVDENNSENNKDKYVVSLLQANDPVGDSNMTNPCVTSQVVMKKPSQMSNNLFKNSILKSTTIKPTIAAVVLHRLCYHPDVITDEAEGELVEIASFETMIGGHASRSELDSHANMVVLGRHSRIEEGYEVDNLDKPGARFASVQSFSPMTPLARLPVVNGCIAFRDADQNVSILHFTDALYDESADHNLIPPFILREAGWRVNDTPRFQCVNPTDESHCIISEDDALKIPLSLHGVFSYFPTFRPTEDQFHHASPRDHYFMTPTMNWNPNTENYARKERSFRDHAGNIIPPHIRQVPRNIIAHMEGFSASSDEIDSAVSTVSLHDSVNSVLRMEREQLEAEAQLLERFRNGDPVDIPTGVVRRRTIRNDDNNEDVRIFHDVDMDDRKPAAKPQSSSNESFHSGRSTIDDPHRNKTNNDDDDAPSNDRVICSVRAADLPVHHAPMMPETSQWEVYDDSSADTSVVTQDWTISQYAPPSTFATNVSARASLGHMAMAIGSTATWNDDALFPDLRYRPSGEDRERNAANSSHSHTSSGSSGGNANATVSAASISGLPVSDLSHKFQSSYRPRLSDILDAYRHINIVYEAPREVPRAQQRPLIPSHIIVPSSGESSSSNEDRTIREERPEPIEKKPEQEQSGYAKYREYIKEYNRTHPDEETIPSIYSTYTEFEENYKRKYGDDDTSIHSGLSRITTPSMDTVIRDVRDFYRTYDCYPPWWNRDMNLQIYHEFRKTWQYDPPYPSSDISDGTVEAVPTTDSLDECVIIRPVNDNDDTESDESSSMPSLVTPYTSGDDDETISYGNDATVTTTAETNSDMSISSEDDEESMTPQVGYDPQRTGDVAVANEGTREANRYDPTMAVVGIPERTDDDDVSDIHDMDEKMENIYHDKYHERDESHTNIHDLVARKVKLEEDQYQEPLCTNNVYEWNDEYDTKGHAIRATVSSTVAFKESKFGDMIQSHFNNERTGSSNIPLLSHARYDNVSARGHRHVLGTKAIKTMANALNECNYTMPRMLRSKANMIGSMDVRMKHYSRVKPEQLQKAWKIDRDTAVRTIRATTQRQDRRIPTSGTSLKRNRRTNDKALRYNHINDYMFMDTMFASGNHSKSLRGNTCAQIFTTDKGYIAVYPLMKKGDVPRAIKLFCKEVGVPDAFICDQSMEQTSKQVKAFIGDVGSSLRVLEEGTPWANRAELVIGQLKQAVRTDMKETNTPLCLWDYCLERRAIIANMTAKDLLQLRGQTPYFATYGHEADISNLTDLGWYEFCYYYDHGQQFPLARECLGRYLGPSKGYGNKMSSWVLKANGKVVSRRTIRPLTDIERTSDIEAEKRMAFNKAIKEKLGDGVTTAAMNLKESLPLDELEYDSDDEKPIIQSMGNPVDNAGREMNVYPAYDKMLNQKVIIPCDGEIKEGQVQCRTRKDGEGHVGTYSDNPFHNTITYDVLFDDGTRKEYGASVIAENMFRQADKNAFEYDLLDSILEFRINKMNTQDKRRKKRKDDISLKILWKDGFEQWVSLDKMKDSYPIETAEFARAKGIDRRKEFKKWVPYVLSKRDANVAKVTARFDNNGVNIKYGVKVPRTVKEAHKFDEENKDNLWRDAINKEMFNVGVAFEILDDNQRVPVGYEKVSGHLIFDVKMDFTRKARYVLDGHKTEKPDNISTYAGVVSRESVRIALTYAALNGLEVCAGDIRNAYLQAPSSQKHFIICGDEFGLEHKGKKALITRALYGGKTAGRDFRNHLRECMRHLRFVSCLADPDIWMRKNTKPGGEPYWEYVLLYTDDCIVVSHQAEIVIKQQIGKYFAFKEESVGVPKIYLGGKLRQVMLDNRNTAWAYSSAQYIKNAIKTLESTLQKSGDKIPRKVTTPLSYDYRPEIDTTPEVSPERATIYQSMIGILRWIVELGRIDICCEVSMMASQLAAPREGHFDEVLHIFGYLKTFYNAEMVFDPSIPSINQEEFPLKDWTTSAVDGTSREILPPNMPQPRGIGLTMRAFVDADHATDTTTRKSRTGFLIYLNSAPIYWTSKKQTGVETSSFGSEFVAMKQCSEYVRGLRYKLQMMGIPVEGPTYIYGDNKSVLYNTSIPESTLKKKSQSICYHFVREGVARDEWRTGYINTKDNPADLLTKPLSRQKRERLVRMMLHHVMDDHL